MQDRIIKLSEMNFEKLNVITLTESGGLMGEIVVIKKGHKHKKINYGKRTLYLQHSQSYPQADSGSCPGS